jgi:hypothetical protein
VSPLLCNDCAKASTPVHFCLSGFSTHVYGGGGDESARYCVKFEAFGSNFGSAEIGRCWRYGRRRLVDGVAFDVV